MYIDDFAKGVNEKKTVLDLERTLKETVELSKEESDHSNNEDGAYNRGVEAGLKLALFDLDVLKRGGLLND